MNLPDAHNAVDSSAAGRAGGSSASSAFLNRPPAQLLSQQRAASFWCVFWFAFGTVFISVSTIGVCLDSAVLFYGGLIPGLLSFAPGLIKFAEADRLEEIIRIERKRGSVSPLNGAALGRDAVTSVTKTERRAPETEARKVRSGGPRT